MTVRTLFVVSLSFFILSCHKKDDGYLLQTKSYKILFPRQPKASTQEVSSPIGPLTLSLNIYEVPENERDDNKIYMTNETRYPDSLISSDKKDMLDNFFRNAIDGASNNVHGKVLSEKIIQLGAYPGREVRIDFQNGLAVITARMYLVKSTMFMLETITKTEKDFNKSIDKFMNSFQLI